MDRIPAGNGFLPQVLSADGMSKFEEGVGLILSSWLALQMAVQNEWGGRDSRQKEQKFAADIVAWLTRSTETRYIDELEEMLDENMILSFNTETEDGSLEEVAEQVMLLHEECLQGNYDMVSKLQISCSTAQPTAQLQKVKRWIIYHPSKQEHLVWASRSLLERGSGPSRASSEAACTS